MFLTHLIGLNDFPMCAFEQNHKSINFKNNLGIMKPHLDMGKVKLQCLVISFLQKNSPLR